MTSAYPPSITSLLPKARRLADSLGEFPSRNKTMSELRIGRGKAKAVLDLLREEQHDTATTTTEPADTVDVADGSGQHPDSATSTPDRNPTPAASTSPAAGTPNPTRSLHLVTDNDTDTAADTAAPATETAAATVTEISEDHVPDEPRMEPTPVLPTSGTPGIRWARWLRGALTPPTAPVAATGPRARSARRWPLLLLAAPAFVAIWSGWVGLGALTGFGPVHPLPGIADGFTINTAITLPIGVETYAAYALKIWLADGGSRRARWFAKWSALGALTLGVAGQIAYHLMTAWHVTAAPWPITAAVACLPVIVLGLGTALAHLQRTTDAPAPTTSVPAALDTPAAPGPAEQARH